MIDVIKAEDVLASVPDRNGNTLAYPEEAVAQREALLACGGGDPVVIMPDGTLRRLTSDGVGYGEFDLTDPVVPDA